MAPTATEDPRVARTRAAVIDAAAELLAEEGMPGFSIDAVSRRSGVARTTIYRHWPESRDLLFDAFRSFGGPPPLPDTGSIRDDMIGFFRLLVDHLQESPAGCALPVLLDATLRDPTLRDLHRRFVEERRQPTRRLLRRGIERGELPAELDVERWIDRLAGPIFYRHLVAQRPMPPAEVADLVDACLTAIRSPINPENSL